MKFEIHSQDSIVKLAKKPFDLRTAVISICDTDSEHPHFEYKPDYMLCVKFDDVTLEELKEEYSTQQLEEMLKANPNYIFNDNLAIQIAEFVYSCKDKIDLLICQCVYGQSRSAGCAAAIAEHFNGNGIDIFANEKYYPNRLAYNKLINAFKSIEERK